MEVREALVCELKMGIGFDKYALHHNLALYLPFDDQPAAVVAGTTLTHDRAKPLNPTTLPQEDHHGFTLTGATIAVGSLASGQPYIDLTRATPDYLTCLAANSQDLDFQTETFSVGIWMNADALAAATTYYLYSRGLAATDGWAFYLIEDVLYFATYQGGASQVSNSIAAAVAAGAWYQVGVTRGGAGAGDTFLCVNGVDVTDTGAAHTNPLTSARPINIGADQTPGNGFDGKFSIPMIWSERPLAIGEWGELYYKQRSPFL